MKKFRYFLLVFIIVLFCEFFICSYSFVTNASNTSNVLNQENLNTSNNSENSDSSISNNSVTDKNNTANITNPDITTYSPACILMDAKTGKVLYEKNSSVTRYPASTTKIMTAILTLENCELTDIATVSHNAVFSVPSGYTHASLREGEKLTIENLLNVLLIPSANDAANVLAEHISGSVEEFAKLMNEKAKEIGCLNTHFVNPNGVHNKNHTSTAYDLALMGRYAMQNATFREIVKKTNYTLPATNKYEKSDRSFVTTNDLLRENYSTSKDNYYYPYAIGIKTGYTSDAGSCIVAGASKDNMEMIAVVLGGESTSNGLSQRYLDCKTLFNYAFDNYSTKTLHEEHSVLEQIKIKGATSDTKNLDVLVKDKISVLLKNDDNNNLSPEISYNDNLKAPIAENSVIGKITYKIDGEIYSSDLIAGSSVVASGIISVLVRIILILVTLYLIFLLLKTPRGKNNYKKKNTKRKSSNSKIKKANKKTSKNYKKDITDSSLNDDSKKENDKPKTTKNGKHKSKHSRRKFSFYYFKQFVKL